MPVVGLAAWLFLWQLGSSSFFIDEVSSVRLADKPLVDLLPTLRTAENSPGGYFALLHLWRELLGSDAEWAARLLSALTAIALVVAVYVLGRVVDSPRTGLIAALLAAVSPLVLQYAQQARAYTLAMLALTLAVIAAVRAVRLDSLSWALGGAAACAVALSLHYATVVVVASLCVWMLARRDLDRRSRLLFCAVPAAAWLAWAPLAISQRRHHPGADLGEYGAFTAENFVRTVSAPFDDRYTTDVGVVKVLGAIAVVGLLVTVAVRLAGEAGRAEVRLLLVLVTVPLLALCGAATVLDIDALNSRYMTFAVPFTLVLAATAITSVRPAVAIGVLGAMLAIALVGSIGSHQRSAFYPDARALVAAVDGQWKKTDLLVEETTLGAEFPLAYYAEKHLPGGVRLHPPSDPAVERAACEGRRIWVVRQDPSAPDTDSSWLKGYALSAQGRFTASVDLLLFLATSAEPSPGRLCI